MTTCTSILHILKYFSFASRTMAIILIAILGSSAIKANSNTLGKGLPYPQDYNMTHYSTTYLTGLRLAARPLATIIVTTTVDEDDGFLGGGTGISLREAIQYSIAGDVIELAANATYSLTRTAAEGLNLTPGTGDLDVEKNLTIYGNGATIDANEIDRVMQIAPSVTLVIYDLTFTNGRSTHFMGSTAFGGGIYNSGNLTLNGCTISSCFSNATIGNVSGHGGGIYNNEGTLTMTNCSVVGNATGIVNFGHHGGGIFNYTGTLIMNNCTVSGNTTHIQSNLGGEAGGIYSDEGTVQLTNCTISGNTGDRFGGGIWLNSVSNDSFIRFCTIVNNTCNGSGGGLGTSFNISGVKVSNSLIAQNTAANDEYADIQNGFVSEGFNLIGKTPNQLDPTTFLLISDIYAIHPDTPIDPLIGTLTDNNGPTPTHALMMLSPAYNAANPGSTLTEDQRGTTRPQFDAPDIGAFESTVNLNPNFVSIEAIDADAAEAGSATGAFRISRTGSIATALDVSYTIGGSASSTDYAPLLSGTITIPAGESFIDLIITPVDDNLVEGTETLTLTLVDGAAYDLSGNDSTSINIVDNDFAYLKVNPSTATVDEGVGVYTSNIQLIINSSPPNGSLQNPATVQLEGLPGGATFDDFTLLTTSVTFPAGSMHNSNQPFQVEIIDDDLVEGSEFFDVSMVHAGYTGIPSIIQENQVIPGFCDGNPQTCRNRQTIRIIDNDLPDYTITTTSNAIVITDLAGNGETLEVTENDTNIRFHATGRIYTINGGMGFTFPADVPLAGVTSITINTDGGDDIINIGGFMAAMPNLTINGGIGDDAVNFNGDITFAANANMDVDMQNDSPTPGMDQVVVATNTNLILSGTGAALIRVSRNILFETGSGIQTENGFLNIEANQQLLPNPGNFTGIVFNEAALNTTGTGNITLKGKGGNDISSIEQHGINLALGSSIHASGNGAVSLEGIAGIGLDNNRGLQVVGASQILSENGDIVLTGIAGNIADGLRVSEGSEVSANNNGSIWINGTGGSGDFPGLVGIRLSGSNTKVLSVNGDIHFSGTGGNGSFGTNDGFRLESAAMVQTTGAGNINIRGTGGGLESLNNNGIRIISSGNITTTGTGSIYMEGIKGVGDITSIVSGSQGIEINSISPIQSMGDISLIADQIFISGTSAINITEPTHQVIIKPFATDGSIAINLGGDDAVGTLGLTDLELDRISAGRLIIGDGSSGEILVSSAITRSNSTDMQLLSGGDVTILEGGINTQGGTLLFNPGNSPAAVKPIFGGTDVIVNSMSISGDMEIVINGSTPADGTGSTYTQLMVEGTINLTNVGLVLSGNHVPSPEEYFIIVDNDGIEPIIGNFNGLPEGATISNFLGSVYDAQISYIGGDGNDVVLNILCVPPTITCPEDQMLFLDPSCSVILPDYTELAGTDEGCGTIIITQFPEIASTVSDTGNQVITLTVSDENSSTNFCTFTVTKVDNISPTISCPATQTLILDTDCMASLPDFTGLANTDDNCGVQSVTQSPIAGTAVSEVGDMTVTLTVTDINGLTNSCSFTVSVEDNTLPMIECFNQTINFNGETSISLDPNDLAEAFDNCGVQNISLSPNSINSSQVGQTIPVLVTVTDINSNSATCTSQISVSGLPLGWSQNVNGVGCANGNEIDYNPSNEVWTVTSTNCYYSPPFTSDQTGFAQRTLCGNGSITAQVTGISGTSLGWAGVTMRESNAPGAKKAQLTTNMSNFSRREFRTITNGAAFPQQFPSLNRRWLRIVRSGNQFVMYVSPNGVSWAFAGAQNIVMGSCIEIGLVTTNYTSNSTVTSTFANVSYTGNGSMMQAPGSDYNLAVTADIQPDFSVYPNPTSGELNVDLQEYIGKNVQIEVYSVEGKLLQLIQLDEVLQNTQTLQLDKYASGMYLVKMKSEGFPDVTKRVVLTKG